MSPDEVRSGIIAINRHDHKRLICALQQYISSQDLAEECLQAAYVEALERAQEIMHEVRMWISH